MKQKHKVTVTMSFDEEKVRWAAIAILEHILENSDSHLLRHVTGLKVEEAA